ncbi:formin-like protein 6 [Andrographis paniculata]|uniref:formin-like protein 6 n=1 Tax=Andrographis paniculata TaxID=175694 RepID=UPI0021E72B06|nr:formin-like protein 6 [Andrographis paniculata]
MRAPARRRRLADGLVISVVVLAVFLSPESAAAEERKRRVLHQPLFPVTSTTPPPPPDFEIYSAPPPDFSDIPYQDQPFSHEFPQPEQSPPQPPPLPETAAAAAEAAKNPATAPKSKSRKEVLVAVASAGLTLAMLSILIFYLYKNRKKHIDDSRKHIAGSSQINEESRMPPSSLLCVETVIPSNDTAATTSDNKSNVNHLPTLPPFPKLPPPPPPMSSSDDENHDDASGYNPKQNMSPSPRRSYLSDNAAGEKIDPPKSENRMIHSVPHSKRTSPRSRFSSSSSSLLSSPDVTKSVTVMPPVKQPWLPSPSPPQPSRRSLQSGNTLMYTPKPPQFSSPPPPLDREKLRSISNDDNPPPLPPLPLPPLPPPPPPPPPPQISIPKGKTPIPVALKKISLNDNVEESIDESRPKLRALHWDKVRTPSETGTVWDQFKSSSFRLNEDAMESLFGCNSENSAPKKPSRKFILPSYNAENRVLDPKKSQNIAILLRALNVTREEVCEALLDGNPDGLGPELLETLVKMAPTKEEENKLKQYNDEGSKLGPAERFLKAILDIPFAFQRVEAMLYRANFDAEVKYLRKSFQTLEEASEELKSSRLFLKLLEAVLTTGNRMNNGTYRGDAKAFKLDTLLKLVEIKGTDGKTTLLHFVVREIVRSEGIEIGIGIDEDDFKKQGLQVVAGLSNELGNVKKAAGMDADVLSGYVSKLESGLQKVRRVLEHDGGAVAVAGGGGRFFGEMREFMEEAADEICKVKAEERKAASLVKEVTHYFHGDTAAAAAARQEAQPLRIFVIVRDFLGVLDGVCKDVGKMEQDRAAVGAGRSFRISANAPLPVLSRYSLRNDRSSDDDDGDDDEDDDSA